MVEELTREAFWGTNNPSCDEHFHSSARAGTFSP
jgi:hypothetical protein